MNFVPAKTQLKMPACGVTDFLNLQRVCLAQTQITDNGLAILAGLKALKHCQSRALPQLTLDESDCGRRSPNY